MILNGFIKLHRQLKDWEWYKDTNTKALFIHCLLSANFKESKWQGILIKRGQFTTSLQHLADESGLSVRNVRTSIEKLEKTGELLVQPTSKFTIITICKFDIYQSIEDTDRQTTDTLPTSDRQTIDKPSTNDRQQLNNDNNKEDDNNEKNKYTPTHENSILKSEPMWVHEIETFEVYKNLEPKLKEAFRFYLDDQQEKEKRGITCAMVKVNLLKVKTYLSDYSPENIAKSLYSAVAKGNKDFNPKWVIEAEQKENKTTDTPTWKFGQKIYTGQ